ncbi:MAG: hypothetical protein Q8S15_08065 [Erysipelotrichaceae bacterium]|nr:hypothetical protein [Erysipelotrichaceae bacterium]
MKKTFVFVVLLLSLFAYKVNATPNTGPVPEDGVKVNFNANGTYMSIEGDGWMVNESDGSMTLTKGEVVITLNEYVFKDGNEIIGFSWMIEGGTAVLWVKHGTTEEVYGDGTSGVFVTSDSKGISNVVFIIEVIVDEDDDEVIDDDDEVIDDEDDEEVIDEEEVVDDEDDDVVLGEEEENIDEEEVVVEEADEVLGEAEESLPDTSDATAGLGLLSGLFGFMMLFATKKKNLLG